MANQGKRMVNENLIAILKEMDSKGISISDLADVLDAFANNEVQAKLTAGDNITITDENVISAITPHLYQLSIYGNFSDDIDDYYISFNILSTNTYNGNMSLSDFIQLINPYNNKILIGYGEYGDIKFSEITFSIINNNIVEIGFNNGSSSTNLITEATINISSVQLF